MNKAMGLWFVLIFWLLWLAMYEQAKQASAPQVQEQHWVVELDY